MFMLDTTTVTKESVGALHTNFVPAVWQFDRHTLDCNWLETLLFSRKSPLSHQNDFTPWGMTSDVLTYFGPRNPGTLWVFSHESRIEIAMTNCNCDIWITECKLLWVCSLAFQSGEKRSSFLCSSDMLIAISFRLENVQFIGGSG